MKKTLLSIFVIVSFFLFMPQQTFAHFPATDGDMTVTLHVDPNDDPLPGQQAHLYFLFNDKSKKFRLANCTCTVSISYTEQGKQPYTQQLIENKDSKPSIWGANIPYIFPERNVYHIVLTGKPTTANTFKPFTVSWYFRVDTINPGLVQQPQGPSDIEQLLGALGAVIIGLVIFGFFIKKEFTGD